MLKDDIWSEWLGLKPVLRAMARGLLFIWVRTRVLPENLETATLSDSGAPVVYVLANNALSGRLVVDGVCRRLGLALPHDPPPGFAGESRSVVFVRRLRGWWRRRLEPVQSPRLARLIAAVREDSVRDVRVVPVSVFWGRSPDKEHSSLKLLFSESWAPAGPLRKLLIILVHGRNTLVQYSRPLSLREFVDECARDGTDPGLIPRKLSRVLRVHMRRLRVATIGPDLSHRRTMRTRILRSPGVRHAIERHAQRQGLSVDQAARQAGDYIDEIAADYSYAFIRFMERLLSALWNRIYDGIEVNHVEQLKSAAQGAEIIYVPCHRSHMDYLLLSYVLYQAGLVPPHVAAGINLNIPVVGPLLRRGGAFFLRRSFAGNKLYAAVFEKYLSLNLVKGVPIEYFIEGTRSRTGRLLAPRSGMLAMTVRTFAKHPDRPIVFVPVYFGYEKMLESRSYIGELSGSAKRKESLFGFVSSLRALRSRFGKVYVNFGEPLPLTGLLDEHTPSWRETAASAERPVWLNPVVDVLAVTIMRRINMAAAVTPVSLVALPLLSAPRQAMLEAALQTHLDMLIALLREAPYSDRVTLPEMSGHGIIAYGLEMGLIRRRKHPLGDVIRAQGDDAILMTYNRNNVMHLFALPSMLACCFLNNREMRVEKIVELGLTVYRYVRAELFLYWSSAQFEERIRQTLAVLVSNGLLEQASDGAACRRPPADSIEAAQLSLLAQAALQTLERYYMTIALLLKHGSGRISQGDLENLCQLMAQRMSMLYQFDAPEFFAKPLFRDFIESLREAGVLWIDSDGLLAYDERIRDVEDDAKLVLGEQIRHSILQVTHL